MFLYRVNLLDDSGRNHGSGSALEARQDGTEDIQRYNEYAAEQ